MWYHLAMPNVTQYEQEDGVVPFGKWFDSLGTKAALKVRTAVAQMEAGNFGDHKSVGAGVWERRINFEKGYRVYFAQDGNDLVLLLWGGTKTRQQSDIDKAKQYWSQYKVRKRKLATKQASKSTPKKSRRKK